MFLEELDRLPTYKEAKKYAQLKGFSLTRQAMSHPTASKSFAGGAWLIWMATVRLSRFWHGEPAIAGACVHQLP